MALEIDRLKTTTGTSPLADTARRLSGLADYFSYQVGTPTGEGWWRLADVTDHRLLADWHEQLTAREGGDRRVAAAYLGGWLGSIFISTWVMPVLVDGRLPLAEPGDVYIHRKEEGWFDAVSAGVDRAAVLSGDALAEYEGTVIAPSRDDMFDALADRLMQIDQVNTAVHTVCRIGMPALWGGLADGIGSWALWLAKLTGRDRRKAWNDAASLIALIAARQSRLRTKPRPFPVIYSAGEELFQVRGTCCLYYRTVENADPDDKGYCTTCPLRTEQSRTRVLVTYLEKQLQSAGHGTEGAG